ncbi:MAG: hypothetical protein JKY43_06470 [Phycisphaerales bacterium]|nr:hypothetical protein [Phycisphaerales bacterium]
MASMLVIGCASTPSRVVAKEDRQYSFWPLFPAEPRVQFLVSYRYSSDIELKRSKLDDLIYGKDSSVLPINKPYGVEMWDGKIYICDIRNPGLVVLDLKKRQTRILTTSGLGGMAQPTDVAISPDGMKYVADAVRGVIFVFDANERHVKSFGHSGFKPVGIAIHGDELYVSDFGTQSVLVLSRHDGAQLRTIGGPGGEDGFFVRPLGIDVDDEGFVYVSDVIKCRLQKFDNDGNFIKAVGTIGDSAGLFVRPKHLSVDSGGIVYVADAAFDNVQMFNSDGQVLMFFGSGGGHPGAMNLPAGVCTTDQDMEYFQEYIHPAFKAEQIVIVTNQFGPNKISVFAFGQLREGMTTDDIAGQSSGVPSGVQEDGETNALTNDIPEVQGINESAEEESVEPNSP